MLTMTCKNHRGARYYTKNPSTRGLHFIQADEEYMRACPEHRMRVPVPILGPHLH